MHYLCKTVMFMKNTYSTNKRHIESILEVNMSQFFIPEETRCELVVCLDVISYARHDLSAKTNRLSPLLHTYMP